MFMAITVVQVFVSLSIVVLSFIVARVSSFVLEKAKHLTNKTKFDLDDRIVEFLKKPLSVLIVFFGVLFAVRHISPDLTVAGFNLTRVFHVGGILIAAYFAARIFAGILKWYGEQIAVKTGSHLDDSLVPFIRRAIYILVFVVAGIAILNLFGVKVTAVLAGLGIASLAIGLALQDTLSNFFSGLWMAFDRPIKVGDFVEIDANKAGYVEDISWRNTKIRTLSNNLVIVPNSKLSQNILTNYQAPNSEMSLIIPVSVGYASDLERVEKVVLDVARNVQKNVKGAVKSFEPLVRYKEFQDSGISFSVVLRVDSYAQQYVVKHEFIKQLHKRFKAEKIEIPFPQRVVYLKKS